jgi:hypothetical protein
MTAKKKAADFCNSISLGETTGELIDMGAAAGARAKDSYWTELESSTRELYVPFTGFYPGSDFICKITEKNGVVVTKNPNIITSLL